VSEVKKASAKQERRTANAYSGSVNVMSGAGWMRKADVRTEDFLIENKLRMSPDAKSYSIKAATLRDLTKQARLEGRIPLLQFDLAGHRYVVLVEDDFLEMISGQEELASEGLPRAGCRDIEEHPPS
jgi:hypothetical protein